MKILRKIRCFIFGHDLWYIYTSYFITKKFVLTCRCSKCYKHIHFECNRKDKTTALDELTKQAQDMGLYE